MDVIRKFWANHFFEKLAKVNDKINLEDVEKYQKLALRILRNINRLIFKEKDLVNHIRIVIKKEVFFINSLNPTFF